MTTDELENYTPKGQLEGFPKEIIARMLECQKEQVDRRDVTVFENLTRACPDINGFSWNKTKEGYDFWEAVIEKRNFDLFFERYPKQDNQYNSQEFNLENYTPKGQLTGFPKEIIAKMLDYQEKQGYPRDVSVFEEKIYAGMDQKGFGWKRTKDGLAFWEQVILQRDFNLFFERYPKQGVCSECKECRKQEYQESKTAKYVQVGDNAISSDSTSTQSSVEIEINTNEEDSQKFRVGDKVIDILTGQIGVVSKINILINELAVLINTNENIYIYYNLDGKFNNTDKYPRLLHYRDDYDYSVIDFNNLPKREPNRWRAENGRLYYFINFYTKDWFFSDETKDCYDPIDNENYNSGNYFRTEVEAEIIAQKLNEYLKQLIQEEHEYERN